MTQESRTDHHYINNEKSGPHIVIENELFVGAACPCNREICRDFKSGEYIEICGELAEPRVGKGRKRSILVELRWCPLSRFFAHASSQRRVPKMQASKCLLQGMSASMV